MSDKTRTDAFRRQVVILCCMYSGYGAMMVSRQMVTILSPALLADESLHFTVQNTGDILAFGTLGAMAGKLIWGPLADRIGGRLTFLIGIVLTALFVAAFGLSHQVVSFTVFAALLYGTKSSGWPGMTKIVAAWYHPQKYGRVWSILSTSSRASVVLGTLFFGGLLHWFHWRTVAFLSTAAALAVYAVCRFFLVERPADTGFLEADQGVGGVPEKAEESARALANALHHPLDGTTLWQGLWAFAKSLRCWLVVVMLMALTCAMAFLDFLPAYLMETLGLAPAQAAMASSVMPLGSLIGLLASIAWYDRFSKRQLRRVLAGMVSAGTGCIVCLQCLPQLGLDPQVTLPVAMGLIIFFGMMISPAYYVPMSVFSIEFGGVHSATLVCLIDMSGFAASASFGFVAGRLAAGSGGWYSFMNLLVAVGLVAVASTWMFMHGEYRAAARQVEPRTAPSLDA